MLASPSSLLRSRAFGTRAVRRTAGVALCLAVVLSVTACDDTDADARDDGEPSAAVERTPAAQTAVDEAPDAAETTAGTRSTKAKKRARRGTALAALATLPVKGRAPMTGYDRGRFGPTWTDTDRNGCDTRNDILATHLTAVVKESNGCVVLSGSYRDPYTGAQVAFEKGPGNILDIDHVVALGNSWATGASGWSIRKRAALANDPLNLLPADASANRQKGDGDAATWLPSNKRFRCAYVARQVTVKQKYGLWVTRPERSAMTRVLGTCAEEPLAKDTASLPTVTDQNVKEPNWTPKAKSTPTPKTTPKSKNTPKAGADVYFQNCTAARDAGAAPVHVGDPGYGSHLDRDGDGVGCE